MNEVMVYRVYDSTGDRIEYCPTSESEAREIALEIGGSYESDVVEYDEDELVEDRIVYSTHPIEDYLDMCGEDPEDYNMDYSDYPYYWEDEFPDERDEDVVEEGVWSCKFGIIHTGQSCTCKGWS
jgi:hypothetical protein